MKDPLFKVGDIVFDENNNQGTIIAHFVNPFHCYVVHYEETIYFNSAYGLGRDGLSQRVVWCERTLMPAINN